MTDQNKSTALFTLKRVESCGKATSLSGGLFQGIQQQLGKVRLRGGSLRSSSAAASRVTMRLNSRYSDRPSSSWSVPDSSKNAALSTQAVFLLSDGRPNRGVTDARELCSQLSTQLERARKMDNVQLRVSTFGFGCKADSNLLGRLAEVGGGNYHYIDNPDDAMDVFAEALGGLLSINCQNVEVTLTPTPGAGVEVTSVLSSYKTDRLPGKAYRIFIGDLFEDEQKDLVVGIKAAPLRPGNVRNGSPKQELLTVHVR
jgi:hypothetical protein